VLEAYRTFEVVIPVLRKGDFWQRLNASVKEIVAREFLAREGYRMHLEWSDEVRHDVDTWSRYWLSQALVGTLAGQVTVTDEEVASYLMKHIELIGEAYEVNIREILSDSLRESLAMLEKIMGGADMKQLARENSKRRQSAARDGESGFFRVGQLPEIGVRALDAPPGTLLGPVRVPNGYSVFTVLARRRRPGDSALSYDSLKTVVHGELLVRKTQARLNAFVAAAAESYHVKFHYDRLQKIDIPPINMVTKRFIGFGGSMLAVPLANPLWEWVREAKGVEKVLP